MTSRHLRPGSIEAVRHCRLRGKPGRPMTVARMTVLGRRAEVACGVTRFRSAPEADLQAPQRCLIVFVSGDAADRGG
jgi:hypothetical protein